MDVQNVSVSLGCRSYTIEIGRLAQLGTLLASLGQYRRILIVTDEHVDQYYGDSAAESLAERLGEIEILTITPGEPAKSLLTSEKLWERLAEMNVDRYSVIVALGGGVVGDLAGFIAATYLRGLPFVQVPTTLLAQVDSSVGGKVGINLRCGKNLVGAFWQPKAVLIDPTTLKTLPDREFISGLGEVVKYGMIMDAVFLEWLETNTQRILAREPEPLSELIARCCRLKADVVERDEYERLGVRAILNYGHTFGHTLEAITEYQEYLHGEAVAIGMNFAARLAVRMRWLDESVAERQQSLLERFGLPVRVASLRRVCDFEKMIQLMRHDKKNESEQIYFMLPQRPGLVERVAVSSELIRETLEEFA